MKLLSDNKEVLKDVRGLLIEHNIDRSFYNDENFLKSFIDTFNKAMELVEFNKLCEFKAKSTNSEYQIIVKTIKPYIINFV